MQRLCVKRSGSQAIRPPGELLAVSKRQGCQGSESQPTPGPLILVRSRTGINNPIFQMGKVGVLRGE